ncbi:MAG TPA: phage capsid protein [Pseudolabrys sp.]|nr:phage capsid protein [Pseudolabrys sp.]
MSGNPAALEAARTIEYRDAVTFQLAAMPGKLRPLVADTGSGSGTKLVKIENRFDELDVQEKTQRNQKTTNTNPDLETRWIAKPPMQFVAPIIDRDDTVQTPIGVDSALATQTSKACRRAQDIRWLQGFYGNALVGGDEAALTSVPFKAANIMAVDTGEAAPAGITKNKLIAMGELMRVRLNDPEAETAIGLVTAKQISNLLKINELVNRDYTRADLEGSLMSGKPTPFMGFTWLWCEYSNGTKRGYGPAAALSVDSNGYRRVPFFYASGMHWESWEEFFGRVTEMPDIHYNTQIYGSTTGGACRNNEDKCFQMLCLEV